MVHRFLLSWALTWVLVSPIFSFTPIHHVRRPSRTIVHLDATKHDKEKDKPLEICIVGAGPSGLLLAHRVLQKGHNVTLMEVRSGFSTTEGRAYALGLGARGRSAIQSSGMDVWQAVKQWGYESERFDLYVNPKIKLRLRNKSASPNVEPSLLLYQTDLCSALLEQIQEKQYGGCEIMFDTRVEAVEQGSNSSFTLVKQTDQNTIRRLGPFDLVAGCDGVNSAVRSSIKHDSFEQEVQSLPGEFKVCRCTTMPPKLDPTSVALLLPKSGPITAFVEPTSNKEGCILFAGRDLEDPILSGDNVTAKDILDRFPLLEGLDMEALLKQLKHQKPSRASSVQYNTYHCGNLVLCGDAAHATGGVSGQGVNSALVDSAVLADCLVVNNNNNVRGALLAYSQRQVPEGKALYDLSFGSANGISPFTRIRSLVSTVRDAVFQGRFGIGRPPLQTLLTTSLKSFADIRRDRDAYFSEKFQSQEWWNKTIAELHNDM